MLSRIPQYATNTMATVTCTARLAHVGPRSAAAYPGDTLVAVLEAMETDYPKLKNYILDDQGRVRTHVAIFIAGTLQPRDTALTHPLNAHEEIFIMQALSGG